GGQNFTLSYAGGDGNDVVLIAPTSSPLVTIAASATFVEGTAGSFTVTAAGVPTPTLSETGALPGNVTFTPATGVLAGTPAAGSHGVYNVTFTAHNSAGDAVQNFTLTVNQTAAITSAASATFTTGGPNSFTVTAVGFPAPTLSLGGTLPTGVTFNAATGVLGGSP